MSDLPSRSQWDRFVADLSSDDEEEELVEAPVREEESRLPQVSDEIRETLMAYESAERMGGDGTALGAGLGGARLAEKLEVVEDSLREVRGTREECEAVRTCLGDLPAKTRHQVMVPVSRGKGAKLAFREGEILHPNEVLVKLGDSYVERTAAQASAVLGRRAAGLVRREHELEAEAEALRGGIAMASDCASGRGALVDVLEDVEETEEDVRRRRAARLAERSAKQGRVTDEDFDRMMSKLESLERMEDGEPVKAKTTAASEEAAAAKAKVARPQAFTGSVVEKRSGGGAPRQAVPAEPGAPSKPLSRFKMSLRNKG